MSAVFRLPYRIKAETADQAITAAKAQAKSEGWTCKTLASCRQQSNGDWIVTLAVYAAEKGVPA